MSWILAFTIPGIHGPWSMKGGGKQIPLQRKVTLSKELILWWRTFALRTWSLEGWVGYFVHSTEIEPQKDIFPSSLTPTPTPQVPQAHIEIHVSSF